MSFILVNAEIVGTGSMLQNRFTDHSEVEGDKATRKVLQTKGTPREQAAVKLYIEPTGDLLYHPGSAIARLLREAGGNHKMKGTRKTVKYLVPSAVLVMDDTVPLYHADTGKRLVAKNAEVDSRPVVIPSTKGRIMAHRPRHDRWMMRFRLRVNDDLLPLDLIHQLLTEGGQQLGIGDFRPEKGGPFGVFNVTSWQIEK